MLEIDSFHAWITIESTPVPEYAVKITGNVVTCWIASEVGIQYPADVKAASFYEYPACSRHDSTGWKGLLSIYPDSILALSTTLIGLH